MMVDIYCRFGHFRGCMTVSNPATHTDYQSGMEVLRAIQMFDATILVDLPTCFTLPRRVKITLGAVSGFMTLRKVFRDHYRVQTITLYLGSGVKRR